MRIKKYIASILALLITTSVLSACNFGMLSKEELQITNTQMYSQEVCDYLGAADDYEQIMALQAADIYDKQLTAVSWEQQKNADKYAVILSTNAEMKDGREYFVDGTKTEYTFNALIPNTKYYVKVQAFDGNSQLHETKVQSFTTQGDYCQRIVNVDGVSNVRDIGGYNAEGNSKVKYGLIYRGARLNAITDKGIATFTQELGIKTELDVRYGTDGGKVVDMEGVAYKQLGMWAYNSILPDTCQPKASGAGLFDERTIDGIKGVFETIAQPENLPVYIHCTAGADRTGTICYLIGGVLGVAYEDLVQDFELTSFSEQGRRWRSSVKNWEFENEGVMQNDEKNFVAFGQMHSLLMQYYAPNGGTLQQAIENYLTGVCDISAETIEAVRGNLLV
jgi:protein tyrosine/serine phosphatase